MASGADSSQLRRFAADLKAESGRVGARGAVVVRKVTQGIIRDAKTMAPVDTGNLRASISATTTGDGRNNRMSAEIGPTANYGEFVETGTSRMAAQPYLFPAADRWEPTFVQAMAQAVLPDK